MFMYIFIFAVKLKKGKVQLIFILIIYIVLIYNVKMPCVLFQFWLRSFQFTHLHLFKILF